MSNTEMLKQHLLEEWEAVSPDATTKLVKSMPKNSKTGNARSNADRVTTDLINKFGWGTVAHPPYSRGVTPSDYHLFPELKKHLGGTHFRVGEELKEEVLSYFLDAAGEFHYSDIKKM
ncbi:hypothetical protein Trydic_g716, partial [Trypoxylus dichotomus]